MDYNELLETKKSKVHEVGFDVPESELHAGLKSFQKYCVRKALKHGRFALFEPPGAGKTFQQLEWGTKISWYTHMPVLLVAPLAVVGQTVQDEAPKFGYQVKELFETIIENDLIESRIWAINYDSLHKYTHLIPLFSGVILDESSILKNFTGETKKFILEVFENTRFKLPCSATPSPNDLNEYGNHSEFLGILDAQDMRSKWFVRDEGMNNYRLKGHAKGDFYGWMATWCIMFDHPRDIGFNEDGYDLPELRLIEHKITTEHRDNGKLFNDVTVDATSFNSELRKTADERLLQVVNIVKENPNEDIIIWVKHNSEGALLRQLIPDSVEVSGQDNNETKVNRILWFTKNKCICKHELCTCGASKSGKVLISKIKIMGMGINAQNCHIQIFASIDFSFEGLYQGIRRSYRFGQTKPVSVHLITTDTMQNVIQSIKMKEKQHNESIQEVSKAINGKTYGLLNHYDFDEYKSDEMWLMKGDTCIEIDRIEDNSLHFGVWSPPFSSLFTYSNYIHDMGNNDNHEAFFKQYKYLLRKIYQKMMPGRLVATHTKDLGVYANSSGYTGQYDFTGEHTRAMLEAGFKLHSKITIWTDPVLEMQRTKTQRLLYKTITSDSTSTGIGMAEYITIFKKWEGVKEDWTPVKNITKKNFPLSEWQKWASPVWGEKIPPIELEQIQKMVSIILDKGIDEIDLDSIKSHWVQSAWFDIKRTDVLNNREGTALGDEKHIAPLQLQVIHRLVNMYTNRGETVFTPFLGIGSEVYMALKNGRKGIGVELKDKYWETAVKNCKSVVQKKIQLSLLDLM